MDFRRRNVFSRFRLSSIVRPKPPISVTNVFVKVELAVGSKARHQLWMYLADVLLKALTDNLGGIGIHSKEVR